MKSNIFKILLMIFLAALAIALVVLMVNVINGKVSFGKFKIISSVSDRLAFEKKYDNLFEKVTVNSKAGDIKVINSDEIKVLVYSDNDKIKVTNTDNNLSIIDEEDSCKFFCVNKKINKIEVYMPLEFQGEFTIDSDYGDVEIDDYINATFNVKIDMGDININGVKDITIDSDYGDINIGSVSNYLNISTDKGDIDVDYLKLSKDSSIKTDMGDISINHTNEIKIDSKTDLGDVKVNHSYSDSEVTLSVKTDLGDINIDN